MKTISVRGRLSLFTILIIIIIVSCKNNSTGVPEDFSIVGEWKVTEVEGAPGPVDESNSIWTFRSDGTYQWFFYYPNFFDLAGIGNYSLDGQTLTTDGIFANTVISESPNGQVTLNLNENRFRFRDDDGDRWTYVRVQ